MTEKPRTRRPRAAAPADEKPPESSAAVETAPVATAEPDEPPQDEREHEHHVDERRGQQLSMQCWRAGQRATNAEEWQRAVELGREATALVAEAPEPHFNLAVALVGLAHTSDDAEARRGAVAAFDAGKKLASEGELVKYAASAVALLEKRPGLIGEPALQYGLGVHLAALGRLVRARRALEAAAADPTIGESARAALAEVPEPQIARAPAVGRNDPCPCGSGKKYKRCHGA